MREYALHLRDDARLRASFEWFRTLNQDVADNQRYREQPREMTRILLDFLGQRS